MLVCAFGVLVLCISYHLGAAVEIPCTNRSSTCIQNLATFIRLDRFPFVDTEIELEDLCRKSLEGYRCSSEFAQFSTCIESAERFEIDLHLNRSLAVFNLLCKRDGTVINPIFRREYLTYSPCIRKHDKKMGNCYYGAKVPEDPEMTIAENSTKSISNRYYEACCAVERYVECTEQEIGPACGNQSANLISTIIKNAAGLRLANFCSILDGKYPEISQTCYNSAARFELSVMSIIVFFTLMCIL